VEFNDKQLTCIWPSSLACSQMPLPYNQSTETFTNLNLPDVNFTSNFLKLHNAINSVVPDIFRAMTCGAWGPIGKRVMRVR